MTRLNLQRFNPEAPFLVFDEEKVITYSEITSKIEKIRKILPKHHEMLGVYHNGDTVSLISSILAAYQVGLPFIVFDIEAQTLDWIHKSITDMGIRTILSPVSSPVSELFEEFQVKEVTNDVAVLFSSQGAKFAQQPVREGVIYAIQTSGTTSSDRKTIMVTESSLRPNIEDFCKIFFSKPQHIFMASPPTFDPFYLDLFCGVASGSALVCVPQKVKAQSQRLFNVLMKTQTSFMQITPTLWVNLRSRLEDWIISGKIFIEICRFRRRTVSRTFNDKRNFNAIFQCLWSQ